MGILGKGAESGKILQREISTSHDPQRSSGIWVSRGWGHTRRNGISTFRYPKSLVSETSRTTDFHSQNRATIQIDTMHFSIPLPERVSSSSRTVSALLVLCSSMISVVGVSSPECVPKDSGRLANTNRIQTAGYDGSMMYVLA